ncbi:MAG: dTMP kinase [Burkholderiales bacterium]
MSERGKLITLEGVDGAGKSTHIEFVAQRLRLQGRTVLVTREPGGTPLAEKLRDLVLNEPMDSIAETLLIFAARADHVRQLIQPALEVGSWVVCDRFSDATAAYQGAGKGVPMTLIQQLAESTHPGVRPDRTLVFDCSYDVARERLNATGRRLDRFEREDRQFFERVREAYLACVTADPERIRLIDASLSLSNIEKRLKEHILFN